ncbi:MAG: hypothetical protein ACD_3C00205G0020 [uncultured bacterium (gcode 4)]|uniref:Uncharacterized protein n=1 Tax=uncultured bacterium (gcode 4) TaxID=1234023 RepID=K2FZY9_9BACT|nr:MAG: hypothetical protein ACD_3C00205G0020 [uncultured bacterium (gcode 4)]
MKKTFKILLLSAILFPILVSAQVMFESWTDRGAMLSGDDRYEAGSNVSLATDVAGDYFAAGWTVEIARNVSQNIFAAGWTVIINGTSWRNVKAAWWNVIIDSVVNWDLMVFGWQINIKRWTRVTWNIFLNWGNIIYEWQTLWDAFINWKEVNFAWHISWNANMNSREIKTASGARISWNLSYSSANNNPQLEGVTTWQKVFKATEFDNKDFWKTILAISFAYLLYRFLFLLIFATILYFWFQRFFTETWLNLEASPWKSFLYWFLYFAAMPFAILIIMLTVIWIPIGLLLLFIYIFSFVFYKLLTVTIFSAFFINKFLQDKNSIWKKFWIILLVSIFIAPWSIIDLILAFFAFWALMQRKTWIRNEETVVVKKQSAWSKSAL